MVQARASLGELGQASIKGKKFFAGILMEFSLPPPDAVIQITPSDACNLLDAPFKYAAGAALHSTTSTGSDTMLVFA